MHDVQWPATQISCETAIRDITKETNTVRADLICYDSDFKPHIVVECKAPSIRLTEKIAYQIASYNRKLKGDYLYLTNGIRDIFFETNASKGNVVVVQPERVFGDTGRNMDVKPLSYFIKRGFVGNHSSSYLKNWLKDAMPAFWMLSNNESEIRFLDIGKTPDGASLSHYYRIFTLAAEKKMAFTFVSSHFGQTYLMGILNEDGVNTVIIELDLDLMAEKNEAIAHIFQSTGSGKIGLSGLFDFSTFDKEQLLTMPERLGKKLQRR